MSTIATNILLNYRTCEFTTFRDGSPQTWPVSPRLLEDGRLLVTTTIGAPQKVFNIRHNPKVSLLFSEPKGSGVAEAGTVLIQGDAIAEDRIVVAMRSVPELAALVETVLERQPAGAIFSSRIGRRLFFFYYMRLLIYVTPRRGFLWPSRDFGRAPDELDLTQVRRVG
jgi:hypothetical protein